MDAIPRESETGKLGGSIIGTWSVTTHPFHLRLERVDGGILICLKTTR
jgi:hypothetical protein